MSIGSEKVQEEGTININKKSNTTGQKSKQKNKKSIKTSKAKSKMNPDNTNTDKSLSDNISINGILIII